MKVTCGLVAEGQPCAAATATGTGAWVVGPERSTHWIEPQLRCQIAETPQENRRP